MTVSVFTKISQEAVFVLQRAPLQITEKLLSNVRASLLGDCGQRGTSFSEWRGVMETEKKPGSSYGARAAFLDTQRRVCLALLRAYAPRGVSSMTGEVLPTPVSSNFTNLPPCTVVSVAFSPLLSLPVVDTHVKYRHRWTNGPGVASKSTLLLDERC